MTSDFTDSDEQRAIYDAVASGKTNLLIEAGAGTGKTSTLLKAVQQVPPRQRILFCAFNKSIADELSKKAPKYIECRTTHSLALKYCQLNSSAVMNTKKLRAAIDELSEGELKHIKGVLYEHYRTITSIVGLAKAYLIPPRDMEALVDMVSKFVSDLPYGVVDYAYAAHTMTSLDKRHIDFDEMLYFSVREGWVKPEYDVIFVDEAQDLNKAQHELLAAALKPGGIMVGCGDQKQSIYLFRGSVPNSMDIMRDRFSAKEMPLMTTWRCDQSITALANEIAGGLRSRPDAQHGSVESTDRNTMVKTARAGDYVIARTNALLVEVACVVMSIDKPFHLINKDYIKRARDRLDRWTNKTARLSAETLERKCKTSLSSEIADNDDVSIIKTLAHRGMDSNEAKSTLTRMINSRSKDGPSLMTIHGCKGLETGRVFVMADQLPHEKSVENPNECVLDQEYNMAYVAVTRAKNELFIVEPNPPRIIMDELSTNNISNFMDRFIAGELITKPYKTTAIDSIVMDKSALDELRFETENEVWKDWDTGPSYET